MVQTSRGLGGASGWGVGELNSHRLRSSSWDAPIEFFYGRFCFTSCIETHKAHTFRQSYGHVEGVCSFEAHKKMTFHVKDIDFESI